MRSLLALRQRRARVCWLRLETLRSELAEAGRAGPVPGSAADFAQHAVWQGLLACEVVQAAANLAAAERACAGLEALERRRLAVRRQRLARSEGRETDERNLMLRTLRP